LKKSKSRRKIRIKKRIKRRMKIKIKTARAALIHARLNPALSLALNPLPSRNLHLSLSPFESLQSTFTVP